VQAAISRVKVEGEEVDDEDMKPLTMKTSKNPLNCKLLPK